MNEPEHATWIWDASVLNDDQEKWLIFFEEKRVRDVYVQVDPNIADSVYRSFLTAAHEQNIRVHALDGSPDYTEADLALFLQKVNELDWDGIHLDVEPYLSSEWKTDQSQAIDRYEQLLKKAAASGFLLGIDIPFWYDEIPSRAGGTLAEMAIQTADYTVIMAYRDRADQIIEAARTELNIGKALGKEVLIAVETIENAEAEGISFFGKSPAYVETEMKKVWKECKCQIAVHHASSWRELVK